MFINLADLKAMHLYKFANPSLNFYPPFIFIGQYSPLKDVMFDYKAFEVLTKNGIELYVQPKEMKYIEIE